MCSCAGQHGCTETSSEKLWIDSRVLCGVCMTPLCVDVCGFTLGAACLFMSAPWRGGRFAIGIDTPHVTRCAHLKTHDKYKGFTYLTGLSFAVSQLVDPMLTVHPDGAVRQLSAHLSTGLSDDNMYRTGLVLLVQVVTDFPLVCSHHVPQLRSLHYGFIVKDRHHAAAAAASTDLINYGGI